ncbi:MAG: LruC domain-containing protein, partial [Firmicutes bacterium]|nr:LruC domain-containing protein [Bacillota bacterium]
KAGPGEEELASLTSVSNGDTFRFFTTDTKGFNSEITVFVNGVNHVAIHVSCSQPIYVGQVFGLFEIVAGKDKNGGVLRECDGTIPDPECGECEGGLTSLSVRYQGSETDATIRVYEDKVQSGNLIHTENNVNNGDEFTITNSGDKMHPKVRITINGRENYTEMHTSCSSGTVEVGDVVDDFLVIAGISKDGGDLCGSVPDPDPDPDPTCEDGSYDITTFGGFTFEFIGVTENINGTSTWTYTVTGDNPVNPDYKNLYHWALALCEDEHNVIEANYNGHESYNENYLNFYGIKWDQGIDKENGVKTFSFTLDDQYNVVPVVVGFKNVDGDLFYCQIYGPSCEGDPDPDPEPELFGNIAFEDLWPGKGDYDLNDLVIEYDFAVTKDNNEYVESITATFEVRCFGAGLHNGFGFTFPNVDRSDIVNVTGYDIVNTTAYSLGSNGTENGQSKATFILYDDTYRLMQHPGSGTGVNTEHPHPYVTPAILTLTIEFANHAVTYSQLDIGNFNPFIVKNQDRDIEIHLPNYPPTDLAHSSYYGTGDDDTNPPDKYYLTENNLPWAIMIPERFDYPVEFQSVLGAYNHFAEWAQGDGITYADWYQDLYGYRNESVIY